MSSRKPSAAAVHRALSGFAIATTAVAIPAQAQETQAPSDLEEITVTGSRIATDPNLISSSPVSQIQAVELTYRGITRVEDLVNDLPQVTPEFTSNDSNGATGTATLDLRGLGSDRTLVLVNGHRMGFGDPYVLSPDINQVPGALIDRVEILTGGASSTYGSDAVSGVVNFIMKADFEGFQLDMQYAAYQHAQGNDAIRQATLDAGFPLAPDDVNVGGTTDVNLVVGINSDNGRGNVTGYAGYRNINSVKHEHYDFSNCALGDNDDNSYECGGSLTMFPSVVTDFDGNYFMVEGDQFVPWDGTYYNYGPLNYFQRPDERFTGGVFGHYQVSEGLTGYAEVMFMDDRSRSQIAPSGAFFVTDTIQCENPFISAQAASVIGCGPGVESVGWYIGRRSVEGGPRIDDLRHTSLRTLAGIRGDLNDNWQYDFSANFTRLNFSETYLNDMSSTRIVRALDVVVDDRLDEDGVPVPTFGQPVCRSVVDGSDPSCVPWNIFQEGGVTQEALDYLVLPLFARADLEMDQYVGFVSGDLTDMGIVSPWAGEGVQMVFGAEYREEIFEFNPDNGFITGDGAGQGGPIPPVAGEQDIKELFTEFKIPVVQDRAGFQDLSLDLRYRYSDYSSGITADTYNIAASWVPTEGIKFRGGFSRAVRAPNLRERFEPQNAGLWSGTDPCAGPNPTMSAAQCANTGVSAAQYGSIPLSPAQQYNAIFGGNPDLEPETSDAITVGTVLTPSGMLNGLVLSLDYWQIEVEDAIDAIDPEIILSECGETADPSICSLVQRGPNGNLWIGNNAFVVSTNVNIGFFEAAGVDLVGNYGWELGGWGGLDVAFRGTYLVTWDDQALPGGTINDCVGTYGGSCGRPQPEWKHITNFVWRTPWDLDTVLGWRFVGEVEAFNEPTEPRVSAQQYIDVSASYYADWFGDNATTEINVGISNLLDNDPPISGFMNSVPFSNGNTVPGTWEALGRYWFAGFTQMF